MSDSVILALIGLVSTVLGGIIGIWAVGVRSRARARVFAAEGELLKTQAAFEQEKIDNQIRIEQVRADTEERTFMREQLKNQLALNEQFQQMLVEKEQRDELNYRVVANVVKDTNIGLSNVHNAIQRQNTAMINLRTETLAALIANRSDQNENMAEFSHLVKTMILDLGQIVSKAMESRTAERDLYPFPNAEDPAWEMLRLEPIVPDVIIHRQPGYADDVKLLKPCAKIAPHGERMKVIRGRLKDWLIVDKTELGERCWGWIPTYAVRIVEPQIEPC